MTNFVQILKANELKLKPVAASLYCMGGPPRPGRHGGIVKFVILFFTCLKFSHKKAGNCFFSSFSQTMHGGATDYEVQSAPTQVRSASETPSYSKPPTL